MVGIPTKNIKKVDILKDRILRPYGVHVDLDSNDRE